MSNIFDIKNNIEEDNFNGLSYSAQVANHLAKENERKLVNQHLEDYAQNAKLANEALRISNEALKVAKNTYKATIIILVATIILLILTALLLI